MLANERTSGILAPLFSLPGAIDLGTLGQGAIEFLNFLQTSKQAWFQTLPINPVDENGSPYAGRSAFAGEILYLDLEELYEEGLIPKSTENAQTSSSRKDGSFPLHCGKSGKINYNKARERRIPFWDEAFERYSSGYGGERYRRAQDKFFAENDFWLNDYAIYDAAAETFGTFDWSQWPEPFRRRDPKTLESFAKANAKKIEQTRFLQLVFDVQWREFREECAKRNIKLFGDLPLYVGEASVDTWVNPDLFLISRDGRMIREAGSPADDYNKHGQRWNSPTYRWSRHFETDFSWWKARIKKTLERFDLIRIDHFIGFYYYYSFPSKAQAPEDALVWAQEQEAALRYATHPEDVYPKGWTPGPQERFFDAIFSSFPSEAFVAEDLGVMNAGVIALRDHYGLPGMNVFQFSFNKPQKTSASKGANEPSSERASNPLLNWSEKNVGYTETHDGAPVLGWLDDVRRFGGRRWKQLDFKAIQRTLRWYRARQDLPAPLRVSRPFKTFFSRIADMLCLSRPKTGINKRSPNLPQEVAILHAPVLRAVASSPCRLVIFPIQDVLGLSNDSRVNFPGIERDAWRWRLPADFLLYEDAEFLGHITDETGRSLGANLARSRPDALSSKTSPVDSRAL